MTTAAGVTALTSIQPGQSLDYSVSGTFTGFVRLERSRTQGASWETAIAGAADTGFSGTVKNETNAEERYRFRYLDTDALTPITGTIVSSLTETDDTVQELKRTDGSVYMRIKDDTVEFPDDVVVDGTRTPPALAAGTSVTVAERGNSIVHQSVLTLADLAVTVANVTGASHGTALLATFPEGRILVQGVVSNLTFDWSGTGIGDTGSGDFSIGTTATADATLGGTDVDLLPSSAMTDPFVAGVGAGTGALAASAQLDGTAGAKGVHLNLIIDDADVADADSSVVTVNGTVTVTWTFLGDY